MRWPLVYTRVHDSLRLYIYTEMCTTFRYRVYDKYTHLHINLVFTRDSPESLIQDIPQLNELHKGHLMFELIRYSGYRSIFSQKRLLTRLLKSLRQPTTDHKLVIELDFR
ncbi:hypothetical protein CSKR_101448 [Clonorchis sinensis]|uniref:Uncharacterized protein n=1 Tax=Clonorchis sinensis TaxID=79923 RepID=A0A3R7JJ53_CLOSI|nr:hypothetical protein CSKR_101448 [Clonorchis sinensis]